MGIATSPLIVQLISPHKQPSSLFKSLDGIKEDNSRSNSMSQGFPQGIFSFSDGFDRPTSPSTSQDEHQQQHHIAQQTRRDKLRVQGFDPPPAGQHPLVPMEREDEPGGIYGTATGAAVNMLSEMFNFSTTPVPSATELLASQMQGGHRLPTRPVGPMFGFGSVVGDWYNNSANRQGMVLGSSSGGGLGGSIGDGKQWNADSAAAMHLFLMNPQQPQPRTSSPLTPHPAYQGLAAAAGGPFDGASSSFTTTTAAGGVVEGQGLSLSLSSSLQQFEMAKAAHDHHHHHRQQELRVRDGVLYFDSSGSSNNRNPRQLECPDQHSESQNVLYMGYGLGSAGPASAAASSVGDDQVYVLRNSKYARPAQELLEEFCSVGRSGQFKGSRIGRRHHGSSSSNPNPNIKSSTAGCSSSSKDVPSLSSADRFEHQRKKSKLLSILDEVSLFFLAS